MDKDFVKKLSEYRSGLKLNVPALARLVGLSPKYLYNIEKQQDENLKDAEHQKKNISFDKLRNIILSLSLKHIDPDTAKFLKEKKNTKDGYFTKESLLPPPDKLNLSVLRDLLFSSVGLSEYIKSYKPVERVHTSETELKDFIETLKGKSTRSINHDYQIWTFSDVLSDSFTNESTAPVTANNIISFKIKYVYFTPFAEETQQRTAFNNVRLAVKKILANSDAETKRYWEKEGWEKYLIFYGLSQTAFLCRFRLYNPAGIVTGNYNVGGTFPKTSEFVNMYNETAIEVRNKLRNIMQEIDAQNSDKPVFIERLDCHAVKRIFKK